MKTNSAGRLTEGPVLRGILLFAVPILLGNLFQNLYNLTDTVIVGRLLGLESLAAVGATGSVNFLVLGFVSGTCAGMAIPVAHSFGAGDWDGLRSYAAGTAELAALFSLVLTPVLVVLTRWILVTMLTPEDILAEAELYIAVIFAGIPAAFLYNCCACILRAVGDSRTPLLFLIFSSVLNVALDLVSVLALKMDVRGPALATVVSQLISGVLCLLYIHRKYPLLRLRRQDLRPDPRRIGMLLSDGVPMGLQYSITAIGSVILQASVNTLGSVSVAAVTVGGRINMLAGNSEMDGLGTAMATYVGQNCGARNYRRIVDGVKKSMLAGFAYDAFAFVLMLFFAAPMASVFVTAGEDAAAVVSGARQLCLFVSASYFMLCILSILRFSIQGLGYSYVALLSGAAEMIARTLLGLVFVPRFGFTAACCSNPLAWLFADITLVCCWIPVIRATRRKLNA